VEQEWTAEEEVSPTLRHHLDQAEAWAIETVNQLARLQAKFYNDLRRERPDPPSSRLAASEEVVRLVSSLDEAALRALVYVYTSHAGQTVLEEADALYAYEQRFGAAPDDH
jgi:hypothetical protein